MPSTISGRFAVFSRSSARCTASGAGISKALESGLAAGECAIAALENGGPDDFTNFEQRMKAAWGKEYRRGRVLNKLAGYPVLAGAGLKMLDNARIRDALLKGSFTDTTLRLIKVPGIGKKTAERLLLELKGKLGADIGLPMHAASDAQADIQQALVALGYSDKEAALALKALPKDVGVSEGIKLALKALAK